MSRSIQFELWKECNSGCLFCFQTLQCKHTDDNLKISACEKAYEKICEIENTKEYDTVAFIGGEFFQGQLNTPEVKESFMKMIKKSAELLDNGILNQVWISATLTIGHQEDLYETIELFNKKKGLWILTSYDTIGRYHTEKMFDTWKFHMKNIKEKYPDIELNTTMILTQDLIEKYLSNDFSFDDFMVKYNTQIFIKHCYKIDKYVDKETANKHLPKFFPKRNDLIKFLVKYKNNEPLWMYEKLFNINFRADELYRNQNDGQQMLLSVRHKDSYTETIVGREDISKCGHEKGYQAYIDSDECVICDKEMIDNMA